MSKKVLCRSLSSIHILYNQASVGGLSDSFDSATRIDNIQLDGGSIPAGASADPCARLIVRAGGIETGKKSRVLKNTLDPVWHDRFAYENVNDEEATLTVVVVRGPFGARVSLFLQCSGWWLASWTTPAQASSA